jgi:hypothetical protein
MAGKITTNSVVLGDSLTDTQNFVLKTNADGTATLARGVAGNLGTVFGVNASNTITGLTSAAMPVGSVLQVVNGSTSTYTTSATSTFANTSLTATITPTSNTSKILVLMSHAGCGKATNNTALQIKVLRGATQIVYLEDIGGSTGNTAENYIGSISVNYLDSPATTSATTYKSQMASRASNATVYVNGYGSVQVTSTITLMEIAA